MYPTLSTILTWLRTNEQSLAIWVEGFALVAIFLLELKEYKRQGVDRKEQHEESAAQLKIMQSQADALVNSERAWIDGELVRETFPAVRYRLKIVNHGKTPARMLSFEINCGCLSETDFSPQSLSMRQTGKFHFLLGADKSRVPEEVEPLNTHVIFGGCPDAGAYCVKIRYADVVVKDREAQERETSFVYYCRYLLDSLERVSQYDEYK